MTKDDRSATQGFDAIIGSLHRKRIGQGADISLNGLLFRDRGIHDHHLADAGGESAGEKLNAPGRAAFPGEDSKEIEVPFRVPILLFERIGKAGGTALPALKNIARL